MKVGGKTGTRSITLKKGKTAQITAGESAGKMPVKYCTGIRFVSGNTQIASVTASGKIKAKKKGTCYIWVYAQNGIYKTITVKVK